MTLAYCPAFDFDPEVTKMTFDQILEILKSPKTDYQKAADLHAALTAIPAPSSLNMQPQKKRKAREKKPRQEVNGTGQDFTLTTSQEPN
jgi:hypothetical protein